MNKNIINKIEFKAGIKELLDQKMEELPEAVGIRKKVIRKGKLKIVKRGANIAQKNRNAGTTQQQRRLSSIQRVKSAKKKNSYNKASTKRKKKRSLKKRKAQIGK